MVFYDGSFTNSELSNPTSIFGLHLGVIIGIFLGSVTVFFLFLLSSQRIRRPRKMDMGKVEHRVVFSDKASNGENLRSGKVGGASAAAYGGPEVLHLGWGRWYTLRELESATNGLANVIGEEEGSGIVYFGASGDNTRVAVKKNLFNNSVMPVMIASG